MAHLRLSTGEKDNRKVIDHIITSEVFVDGAGGNKSRIDKIDSTKLSKAGVVIACMPDHCSSTSSLAGSGRR